MNTETKAERTQTERLQLHLTEWLISRINFMASAASLLYSVWQALQGRLVLLCPYLASWCLSLIWIASKAHCWASQPLLSIPGFSICISPRALPCPALAQCILVAHPITPSAAPTRTTRGAATSSASTRTKPMIPVKKNWLIADQRLSTLLMHSTWMCHEILFMYLLTKTAHWRSSKTCALIIASRVTICATWHVVHHMV